jgi:cell division protein FtsN
VPKARPSFGALAQPATPKVDLPAKPSAKSTARVPIAKIDTTVAGGSSPAPETPLQIVPNLLGSVARAVGAEPATQVAAADPVATPAATASAAAPAPTVKGDGSYAVQLGAPGSEQEAQSMSTRLQSKYTTQLDGMQPSIHQADVNGRSIYRVRVSGLSKADAVALCLKLKAAGGDGACFVAKN